VTQQRKDFGRSLEKAHAKLEEPTVILITSQRGEPHLPIQAWLVWRHPTRGPGQIPGLKLKSVFHPLLLIIAAFDNNFRARGCHHGKQAVMIQTPEGLQPTIGP
jgi:hypothetical protein